MARNGQRQRSASPWDFKSGPEGTSLMHHQCGRDQQFIEQAPLPEPWEGCETKVNSAMHWVDSLVLVALQEATHRVINEFTQWTGHHAYITTQPLCRSTTSSSGQVSQHQLAEHFLLSYMRTCIGARSGAHLVVHCRPVNPIHSRIETSLRPNTSGTFGS